MKKIKGKKKIIKTFFREKFNLNFVVYFYKSVTKTGSLWIFFQVYVGIRITLKENFRNMSVFYTESICQVNTDDLFFFSPHLLCCKNI